MHQQIANQGYFITSNSSFKYQAKRIITSLNTYNRIVFNTQSELITLNSNNLQKRIVIKIQWENIVKYVANRDNQIAILYSNGTLQVRHLDDLKKIMYVLDNFQLKINKIFPQLYWEDEDIYVLNQNKLEIVNSGKKERKFFTDLVLEGSCKNLLGIAESKLIDKQRIIIMHFLDKLTFNIVPIPITELNMKNITKVLNLSAPKRKYLYSSTSQQTLPRQYLLLVIDDKILKIYNMISMKQIFQIKYEKTEHQTMVLTTDCSKQLLIVSFVTKKNKVTKNMLYKINTNYYYKGNDYFKQDQNFFQFQLQIDLKEHLMIFSPRQLTIQPNRYIAIDLAYHKVCPKKSKGELILSTLIINPLIAKLKGFNNYSARISQWKQLREWKDIITSYIQMKNSIDKLDLGFDDDQPDIISPEPKPEPTIHKKKSPTKQKADKNKKELVEDKKSKKSKQQIKKQMNKYTFNQIQAYQKMIKCDQKFLQYQKSCIIEQQEIQMKKMMYEKLKNSLVDGANKFQNQKLNCKNVNLNHAKQLQEEFYKFMKQYLRQQQIDIDPQTFLHIQIQNVPKKGVQQLKPAKQTLPLKPLPLHGINEKQLLKYYQNLQKQLQRDEKQVYIQSNEKVRQFLQQYQKQKLQKSLKNEKNVGNVNPTKLKQNQKKQIYTQKKKLDRPILGSKSSEQLSKNTVSNPAPPLNRIKTTLNEQQNKNSDLNKLCSFSEQDKMEVVTKSQQNIQDDNSQNQNQLIYQMTKRISEQLTKVFEPLQKKFDSLNQKINRMQTIHIAQLKKCQRLVQRQQKQLNNIDMTIKGYCYELIDQFDRKLQNGLKSYWNKIQEVDRKTVRLREKVIDDFGTYIDHRIREREQIFDHSRMNIENNLSHIRRKLIKKPQSQDQMDDDIFDDDQIWNKRLQTKKPYQFQQKNGMTNDFDQQF